MEKARFDLSVRFNYGGHPRRITFLLREVMHAEQRLVVHYNVKHFLGRLSNESRMIQICELMERIFYNSLELTNFFLIQFYFDNTLLVPGFRMSVPCK